MIRNLTALALLLVINLAAAQAPLTLDEALRLGRQNNLQLKQQQLQRRIAELEVAIKRGQLWPSLDASATTSYTDEIAKIELPFTPPGFSNQIELGGHDRTDLAIGLRQPLFTGMRLRTQVDLAKTALQSEEARLVFLNQQTALQVYRLFYQAQILKKERKIQEASRTRLSVQLDQTRNLFRAAQVMAYDTLQVYNQGLQIKIQMDQNQRDQRLIELQLARLLDLSEIRPIAETDLSTPTEFRISLDSLKQVAIRHRPELNSVRLGQRAAQLTRKLARGSYFPEIGAEAKYHYAKPGLNQVANEWMDYSTVGLNLQWNLWRWKQDRYRVQEAEVEYNRLTLAERELLRNIEFDVEKSWENAKFAFKQIHLTRQLLAQQQERYRIISAQQREGVATTNDVIVAEADLTQAELQVQRALIQYYLSQSEMLLATGMIAE
ncbi:MAG: TolC family protein [candidate division KSB1 bacterium]|nr:TolC family protein [candidate division KSB1 bacterium]MDZ7302340.1 TolC family protein [candidate division KSB1 bacterium]MDZ7311193.1 TolC family protein [candidate division KSB1 bacterium]